MQPCLIQLHVISLVVNNFKRSRDRRADCAAGPAVRPGERRPLRPSAPSGPLAFRVDMAAPSRPCGHHSHRSPCGKPRMAWARCAADTAGSRPLCRWWRRRSPARLFGRAPAIGGNATQIGRPPARAAAIVPRSKCHRTECHRTVCHRTLCRAVPCRAVHRPAHSPSGAPSYCVPSYCGPSVTECQCRHPPR